MYGKCSKISNIKKERTPSIYFLSSPFKHRKVTNFAKGGNVTNFAKGGNVTNFAKGGNVTNFAKGGNFKIGYFPHRIFGIFLLEIKILLFEFLEHLP